MKKTILKVLASMLVLAMAITALVIPNSTAKAATDYYLHGWINGADCNGADLKFTDGKLSTTFTQESYVYVNDGSTDYMTNGWLGNDVKEATLYEKSTLGDDANKLYVPAGDVTFTLVVNSDNTMTLSYKATVKEYDAYYVAGDAGLCGENWNPTATANVMTKNGDGTYTITFTNIAAGSYGYKVTTGGWNDSPSYGDSSTESKNFEITVSETSDVTITFSLDTLKATATITPVEDENDDADNKDDSQTPDDSQSSQTPDDSQSSQTPDDSQSSQTPDDSQSSQTPDDSQSSQTPNDSQSSQTPSDSQDKDDAKEESKNDYVQKYTAASIAGDFKALANANIKTDWDVAKGAADMTHLGNGIYVFELTFDKTTEEVTVNYKVAFNNAWDTAIGYDYTNKAFTTAGGSDNLYITIPAGATSVKIYADENGLVAYNTIQSPDEVNELLAKLPKKGDMSTVAIYMVLFAGAALVAVGAISKKKFA